MDTYKASVTKLKKTTKHPSYRYTMAQEEKKLLVKSAEKLNARLQHLVTQEQRNLAKAKIIESTSTKIIQNKEVKFFNERRRQLMSSEQEEQYNLKRQQIQEIREKQKLISQERQGFSGESVLKKKESIAQYKERLKQQLKMTLSQVYAENKHIHELERIKERERRRRLEDFRSQMGTRGKTNYELKVQQEILLGLREKERISALEQKELELLERLNITKQLVADRSQKMQEVKQTPFEELVI